MLCSLFTIRYTILLAAVDYAENLVALSCGRLKSMLASSPGLFFSYGNNAMRVDLTMALLVVHGVQYGRG